MATAYIVRVDCGMSIHGAQYMTLYVKSNTVDKLLLLLSTERRLCKIRCIAFKREHSIWMMHENSFWLKVVLFKR